MEGISSTFGAAFSRRSVSRDSRKLRAEETRARTSFSNSPRKIRSIAAGRRGVQQDAEPALLAARVQLPLDRVQHLRPPGRIGGVGVEEERLAAAPPDLGGDPLRVRKRRLAVEVDAGHRHARSGERERGGLAEPGGGAEDQRPAGQTDRGIVGTMGHQRASARLGNGRRRAAILAHAARGSQTAGLRATGLALSRARPRVTLRSGRAERAAATRHPIQEAP